MTALIAGGGIAGLTLALALARRGLTAQLIERAPRLEETGAGVQLSPNAGRVLDGLGLGGALDAVAVRPEAVAIVDAGTGRTLRRLPLGAAAERRWGAPYRVVHRADLQTLLLKAARASGRVEFLLGTSLERVRETGERVEIDVAGLNAGALSGDWLAGCDGLRSVAREAVKLPTSVAPSGLTAWRATMPANSLPAAFDQACVSVWLGGGAHMVVYPVRRGGRANVVLIGDDSADAPATLVAGWAAPAREAIAAGADGWTPWPLFDRPPDARMQAGRVALVGDAAHPAFPSLAQGAGFAIEDAAVLARLVADRGVPEALPAYQEARLRRVARMQSAARRQMRIDHLSGVAAKARNAALRLAPDAALIGGLDWIYGWRDAG
ncbi:FAD-dependent monooxygenase [Methylopila sp. M107]|uniref:FAD-dependent monooxygenase n=1 Tax=Methylopila sp. M107 TaxID=1101190 RepID=UPI0003657900|nr:FAD-dependent monooxygenase [Methylopila sp. M107]